MELEPESQYSTCERCGCALGDEVKHAKWHDYIENEMLDDFLIELSDNSSL